MFGQYKMLIINRLGMLLMAVLILPSVAWAEDFEKRYPNIHAGVEYRFEYWENLVKKSTDETLQIKVPDQVIGLIVEYYDVPKQLEKKLFTRVVLKFDDKYLIEVDVLNANDPGKFPDEFSAKKVIAQRVCDVVSKNFDAYCRSLSDISTYRPQVIVDVKEQKIIPVPLGVKATPVAKPTINIDNFEWIEKKNILAYENMYIGGGSTTPGLFSDMKFSFEGEALSHRCFAGTYGISDVNGDAVNDLLVVGGRAEDQMYVYQVEPKIYAYARVYVQAIDISQGVAKPLFQEELFAYEIDYTKEKKGISEGIVREARFYWGDFNKDSKADYMVRRQHADVTLNRNMPKPTWQLGTATEEAIIYEGTGTGYTKSSAGGEEFLKFVQGHSDWNQGFPDPHNCL